jgi:hypothetical protein
VNNFGPNENLGRLNTPAANDASHNNPLTPLIARAKLCEYAHLEIVIGGVNGSINEFVSQISFCE